MQLVILAVEPDAVRAAVLAAAWIIGRLHLPRIVLWLILLTFLVLMDTGLVGL